MNSSYIDDLESPQIYIYIYIYIAQSTGELEYTDCISEEG